MCPARDSPHGATGTAAYGSPESRPAIPRPRGVLLHLSRTTGRGTDQQRHRTAVPLSDRGSESHPRHAAARGRPTLRAGCPCATGHWRAVREKLARSRCACLGLRLAPGTAALPPRTSAAALRGHPVPVSVPPTATPLMPSKASKCRRGVAVFEGLQSRARRALGQAGPPATASSTGDPQGAFVSAAFFGYFLCQDKKNNPPAP